MSNIFILFANAIYICSILNYFKSEIYLKTNLIYKCFNLSISATYNNKLLLTLINKNNKSNLLIFRSAKLIERELALTFIKHK